jgi:hypothetical protein
MANSYLNRTTGSPSNADKVTISAWIKRTKPGAEQIIIGEYGSSTNRGKLQFKSNDTLEYYQIDGGSETIAMRPSRLFRDPNAFYHIVIQYDSAQSTSSDRFKIYVNGTQETVFDYNTYPSQNLDFRLNKSGVNLHIGQDGNNGNYFEGYISHIALVDNAISAPTVFGETDSTSGIWKFKSPSGVTWGDNGFHLKFENSGNLGLDSSGEGNNFTTNGNLKQAVDTPSNVYATWNPVYGFKTYTSTYANGNTTVTTGSTQTEGNPATLGASSGKWYWEVKPSATSATSSPPDNYWYAIGAMAEQTTTDTHELGHNANAIGYYGADGTVRINDSNVATLSTYITGDIIGIALDLDNNLIYFYKNGAIQNSGTGISIPAASSTPFGFWFPAVGDWDNNDTYTLDANFGNGFFGTTAITSAGSNGNGSLFEYDVPSGYYALNTKNINTYG